MIKTACYLLIIFSALTIKGQNKMHSVEKQKAVICFSRVKWVYCSATKIEIIVNEEPIGKLKNGQRLIYETSICDTLRIKGYNHLNKTYSENTIVLKPEPGKTYYIETYFYGGVYKPDALIYTGTTVIPTKSKPMDFGIELLKIEGELGEQRFKDETLYKAKHKIKKVSN